MPWTVEIVKRPPVGQDNFRADFFPRTFHYKSDALELKHEVEHKGGIAKITKAEKQNVRSA